MYIRENDTIREIVQLRPVNEQKESFAYETLSKIHLLSTLGIIAFILFICYIIRKVHMLYKQTTRNYF